MLTTITAITGVVFGLSALLLSLLNYRRDRPKLLVSLRSDALTVRETEGRGAKFSQIYITNIGATMTRDHRRSWREFRAFAVDSTGKRYLSKEVTGPARRGAWVMGGHPPTRH